eukprot:CAMPEP_0181196132 /NCGR_PEP_ID=MMETSP1096-20121128/15282_1 /TAXON_ID=156174 ORGANISM="Chrysochromulina ericina, Strain CCMP281" /NCGR_SAMPLE_ID=MMETSP1096 /ASSEMBLY_ACC=CAM_ASM_000453 /LENGTH=76 /DNA_ID=CAMNT_0023285831 /DNA_START=514 /DNA_END=744 /DNA_ORIENTATION=-
MARSGRNSTADRYKLHLELKRGASRYVVASAVVPIPQIGRDGELPSLTNAHAEQPCIPAFDHLARAYRERQGFAPH